MTTSALSSAGPEPRTSRDRTPRSRHDAGPDLTPIGPTHPLARRYSLARRNLLPRDEPVIAVHGSWAHQHLRDTGTRLEALLWCPTDAAAPPDDQVASLARQAEHAHRISPRCLARLQPGQTAPGLLSLVRLPRWGLSDVLHPRSRLVLVADGIEYAGNLGTLVRSADASGADGVLLTSPVARRTHPKVFDASRGTVLDTPVVECGVEEARAALAQAGFTVVVADPSATVGYHDLPYPSGRVAIVVGSEGDGVVPAWRRDGIARVAIPMSGRADSLNVAVSAGILLFDARARLGARSVNDPGWRDVTTRE